MLSAFGERVTPDTAWAEYPRPQLRRARWHNLNGLWDYALRDRAEPEPAAYDGKVLVPFCLESALSGVGRPVGPEQRIWYRRAVVIPEDWQGQRVLLHFGAVDYAATVWVNQALAGSHAGGFTPFAFDITPFLRAGANEIKVSVVDPSNTEEIPSGKQRLQPSGIWYTPVSGIWQTVWLEPVPMELAIADLRITPDIDREMITIEAFTDRPVAGDRYAVRVTVRREGEPVATAMARINRAFSVPVRSPELWSPDHPFLYELEVALHAIDDPFAALKDELGADGAQLRRLQHGRREAEAYARATPVGAPLDVVGSYFGMRKVSLGPGRNTGQPVIHLNNQPLFQYGTLDQGWWPDGLHTPPSDEAIQFELRFLKEAGFNMLRKHIKVEPARYYYHCDRLGILVWQDMPSAVSHPDGSASDQYLAASGSHELRKLPAAAARFEHELRTMLNSLHNHPSIVMWVVFNEGWGQYDTCRLANWVKGLDASRLVMPASGWVLRDCGDVYSLHTYDTIPRVAPSRPEQAVVIGEFGGIGYAIEGHLWNPDMRIWGYQKYASVEELLVAYRVKFNEIIRQERDIGISAAVYTQTSDVEGEVNGLLTYDRRIIKIPAARLRAIHREVFAEPVAR